MSDGSSPSGEASLDFPFFFIDHVGNRLLMAVTAIIHVLINHPFAVGGYPLLVLMERWAWKTKNRELDEIAYKITFIFFIVTTTFGAITGVGIWLTSALIAPFAIGSLLRVFFGAWATEWIVFIIELILILSYYLTWHKWQEGRKKIAHMYLGLALAVFSWITMAIITAILGFMMNPGQWNGQELLGEVDVWAASFNPLYLPQLAFRTGYSMLTGGVLVWFLILFFTKNKPDFRAGLIRRISAWILLWLPFSLAGGAWYWRSVPDFMKKNVDVALLGKTFAMWHDRLLWIGAMMVAAIFISAIWGFLKPRTVKSAILIFPFFFSLWLLGHFERVREFVRKPYIISNYMYANGIRKSELPVLQRDGMLTYATYVKFHEVTESNMKEAGKDVFMIACSRCHTATGMNGAVNKFDGMYGGREWQPEAMKVFLQNMNTSHPYMPPFPGNEKEMEALIAYLQDVKENPRTQHGAQHDGIQVPQISDKKSEGKL